VEFAHLFARARRSACAFTAAGRLAQLFANPGNANFLALAGGLARFLAGAFDLAKLLPAAGWIASLFTSIRQRRPAEFVRAWWWEGFLADRLAGLLSAPRDFPLPFPIAVTLHASLLAGVLAPAFLGTIVVALKMVLAPAVPPVFMVAAVTLPMRRSGNLRCCPFILDTIVTVPIVRAASVIRAGSIPDVLLAVVAGPLLRFPVRHLLQLGVGHVP